MQFKGSITQFTHERASHEHGFRAAYKHGQYKVAGRKGRDGSPSIVLQIVEGKRIQINIANSKTELSSNEKVFLALVGITAQHCYL